MKILYSILTVTLVVGLGMFLATCGRPGPQEPNLICLIGGCMIAGSMFIGVLADCE